MEVDVAGRQGTINLVIRSDAVLYYRIAVDIRDHEIIPVQALNRGLLEVCLTPYQFDLLKFGKNGASGLSGVVYRRPLPNFDKYGIMYLGSFKCAWDSESEQHQTTLEMRCGASTPLILHCPSHTYM